MLLNNDSSLNRELISFLKEKLDQLYSCGVIFDFHIVQECDKQQFVKSTGITELPTCMVATRKLVGPTEIKGALIKVLTTSHRPSTVPQRLRPKDPQEELREYQESMMTREAMARDEAEGDNDDARVVMERDKATKLEQMSREREKMFARERNERPGAPLKKRDDNVGQLGVVPSKTKTDDIRAAVDKGNRDDMMLAQMLEES